MTTSIMMHAPVGDRPLGLLTRSAGDHRRLLAAAIRSLAAWRRTMEDPASPRAVVVLEALAALVEGMALDDEDLQATRRALARAEVVLDAQHDRRCFGEGAMYFLTRPAAIQLSRFGMHRAWWRNGGPGEEHMRKALRRACVLDRQVRAHEHDQRGEA